MQSPCTVIVLPHTFFQAWSSLWSTGAASNHGSRRSPVIKTRHVSSLDRYLSLLTLLLSWMVNVYKRHFVSRLREFARCLSLLQSSPSSSIVRRSVFARRLAFWLRPGLASSAMAQVVLHASCWRASPSRIMYGALGCLAHVEVPMDCRTVFTRHE
ncbi:hypothetical protein EDB83DRAFT_2445252 [Lactarius deliciosus]|nr:hypothetical protein EDB83DRAFT_2445252 [Lactarius deliciosus]